jgi:hypothetical protein
LAHFLALRTTTNIVIYFFASKRGRHQGSAAAFCVSVPSLDAKPSRGINFYILVASPVPSSLRRGEFSHRRNPCLFLECVCARVNPISFIIMESNGCGTVIFLVRSRDAVHVCGVSMDFRMCAAHTAMVVLRLKRKGFCLQLFSDFTLR